MKDFQIVFRQSNGDKLTPQEVLVVKNQNTFYTCMTKRRIPRNNGFRFIYEVQEYWAVADEGEDIDIVDAMENFLDCNETPLFFEHP